MTTDSNRSSRRGFLKCTIAAAGAMAATVGTRTVSAAEPPARFGGPKMKLSLAAYSFNRILKRYPTREQLADAEMTLGNFIDFCAKLNLDGTELTSYYFPKFVAESKLSADSTGRESGESASSAQDAVQQYLVALKGRAFRLGLDVSGTAIGNNFCLPEGSARQEQLEMTRRWIDHAVVLGAPVIRIFAGRVPRGGDEPTAIKRCIEGINESLEYAEARGVALALENHGGITATPAQMMRIINGVKDSPWFGVNFDSGNFRTDDPYGDLEKIAPFAINAQIKVEIESGGKKQPADLPRLVGILKYAEYRGYVVLEYEAREDPMEHIPRYIETLRQLIDS